MASSSLVFFGFVVPALAVSAVFSFFMLLKGQVAEKLILPVLLQYIAKKNIPLAILGIHFYLSTLAMPFLLRLSIAFCSDQRINMANPREQFAQLTGFSKRVHSLTQNFQEGLVPFASAVLMATIQHVPLQTATSLACLHMLARAVYTLAFLLNVPMLRAVAYYISTFCSLSLMAYSVSPKFDERFQAVSRAVQSYALAIQLFKK